ncbi:rhamnan synthesis F family protein [Limimaricola pyoseonensis]|uniref:rhamnan synthesis F family protein n=1 Tax=Limimaricola pyoseonensis TaxID=521013 RepID=UPI0013F4D675|nr:rhamnan synthesis F family protein [Limimaricola pyoseonensis]
MQRYRAGRVRRAEAEAIRRSAHFDALWYLGRCPEAAASGLDPALHYLLHGAAAGHDPGPGFNARGYLSAHPDVARAGMNPLVHYERFGRAEGREVPLRHASSGADYAIILHAYHLDLLDELKRRLAVFPDGVDLYVTYPKNSPRHSEAEIRAAFPRAVPIAVENAGQDVGAFVQAMERIDIGSYAFFCKLHTKGGDKLPELWRAALFDGVAGSPERVAQYERLFRDTPGPMIGGARELYLCGAASLMENAPRLEALARAAGLRADPAADDWGFFAGTVFWISAPLVARLMEVLRGTDFTVEEVRRDGQLAHAVERFFGLLPCALGGQVALASSVDAEAGVTLVSGLPEEAPRDYRPMRETLRDIGNRRAALRVERRRAATVDSGPVQGDYAVLTPTGDRPVAFNRCIDMVLAQTVRPREWIVVDDGVLPLTEQMRLPGWVTYVRREARPDDAPHTLSHNILAGLEHISAERVLIMEDDDWYSPRYAAFLLPYLDDHDMAGLNRIRYHHLRGSAWKEGFPPAHTAFAQTGFRMGHASAHLAAVCRTGRAEIREKGLVDRHWWQSFEGRKILVGEHPRLHAGLKGGFGRPGLASGHGRHEPDYIPDPDGAELASYMGDDARHYRRWRKAFRKPYALCTALDHPGAALPRLPEGLEDFDLYVFAGSEAGVPEGWTVIPFDAAEAGRPGARRKPKIMPHLYLPDYEWSLWADAGALGRGGLGGLGAEIPRLIERETEAALLAGDVRLERPGHGFWRRPGLSDPELLVRRHNSPDVARLMAAWWGEVLDGAPARAAAGAAS